MPSYAAEYQDHPVRPLIKQQQQQSEAISYDINLPYTNMTDETSRKTPYPAYLPTWDPVFYEPLPFFHYEDPALRVRDQSKPNLLKEGVTMTHITPKMGTILYGVQLNQLSDAAKDELALLISERKVVTFPDQDMIDAGPAKQQAFMKHFGKPHYQPVSGTVKGYPGFHIIHRNGNKEELARFFQEKATSTLWHQDVSYEKQPPGYVMLGLLQGPQVGGDTVFASTDEAYSRLSPSFQGFIDNIKAVHSSENMTRHVRGNGGLVRKEAVTSVHPLVRVHPVTGKRCIFINGEFITKLQGLKEGESKFTQEYLMTHIMQGHDFQARVKWQPRTIVMFDNRSTIHSAIVDYIDEEHGAEPRHIFRLCAMTEVPVGIN